MISYQLLASRDRLTEATVTELTEACHSVSHELYPRIVEIAVRQNWYLLT